MPRQINVGLLPTFAKANVVSSNVMSAATSYTVENEIVQRRYKRPDDKAILYNSRQKSRSKLAAFTRLLYDYIKQLCL